MRSIIQHLRFPFSYLLMPVFLLAISLQPNSLNAPVQFLFLILHLLVYPSSNAFNSTQDRDTGSVGLIKEPLPIDNKLTWIAILFDTLAIILACLISLKTAFLIFIYILVSRLYSYRKVRLKKYPILGFLIVFSFQGAWIYFIILDCAWSGREQLEWMTYFHAAASSFLIGSIYPLSQIYQHESDKADGVITISYLLGKKGTFIFSGILFLVGSCLLLYPIFLFGNIERIWLYIVCQIPSLTYFNYWFYKVVKDESQANFKHTMRMSLISATCMIAYLLYLNNSLYN